MKKIFSFISILLSLSIILLILLAPDVPYIGDHIYTILITNFCLAILFGLLAEKGRWRKAAFISAFSLVGLFVLFQVVMTILWSSP